MLVKAGELLNGPKHHGLGQLLPQGICQRSEKTYRSNSVAAEGHPKWMEYGLVLCDNALGHSYWLNKMLRKDKKSHG